MSMAISDNQTSRVRIYVCGGVGTNIAKVFESDRGVAKPGYASLEAVYVDTSKSDLDDTIDMANVYLLEKKVDGSIVDGSGKLKIENGKDIQAVIKDVLRKHPPLDYNIVLSSTSGGSGSVFAPMITGELLSLGLNTVEFGVGTTNDKVEIRNNITTIKSYDGVARVRENCADIFYAQYGGDRTASEINQQIQEVISGLSVLFSRQNVGMDTKDLANWQNHCKASGCPPKLYSLHMIDDDAQFAGLGNVISVATLHGKGVEIKLPVVPDYHIRGVSSVEAVIKKPVHFVIADGGLIDTLETFEQNLSKLTADQAARVATKPISGENDKPDANGIVW